MRWLATGSDNRLSHFIIWGARLGEAGRDWKLLPSSRASAAFAFRQATIVTSGSGLEEQPANYFCCGLSNQHMYEAMSKCTSNTGK